MQGSGLRTPLLLLHYPWLQKLKRKSRLARLNSTDFWVGDGASFSSAQCPWNQPHPEYPQPICQMSFWSQTMPGVTELGHQSADLFTKDAKA